jgi:D-alanyl-D-alanine carboxypeptidase (penicillin-binding protein 5/6)
LIRAVLLSSAAALTLSTAAPAAAPPYDTPAPVAYLIDLSSGAELLVKDANRRMPPASMAKMMQTELAFELIDQGQLPLAKMCTVQPTTWQKWHGPAAGSTMFLSPGEQVSVENLLHGVVTLSGNDAAIVLAECVAGTSEAFVAQENALAKKIGLTNSYFGTPNGWPDNGVTMVTARDLAKLARASKQDNRNPLLGRVPGADGLKTGHTDEAGYGFVGSAEQNGRRLIVVMAGMTSFNQRIAEGVRLMNWGFNAWTTKPLYAAGARVGSAKVQLGSAKEVSLVAPGRIALTMPAGLGSQIKSTRIRYDGPLKAPIAKGAHVADLVVTTDNGPQVMPLVAGEAVAEAGFFGRAWIGLKQMLGMS